MFSITKREWGTSEVGETYRIMAVASNAKANECGGEASAPPILKRHYRGRKE